MMGFLAEMAGRTFTGTLIIFLIGIWRAKNSSSFGGAAAKALNGTTLGWLIASGISAWGAAPNELVMILSPILLLPSLAIAFFIVYRIMIKIERDNDIRERFE